MALTKCEEFPLLQSKFLDSQISLKIGCSVQIEKDIRSFFYKPGVTLAHLCLMAKDSLRLAVVQCVCPLCRPLLCSTREYIVKKCIVCKKCKKNS